MKLTKEEFKKKFLRHFCNHEWKFEMVDDHRGVYICTKCGIKVDEATVIEKEMKFDRL